MLVTIYRLVPSAVKPKPSAKRAAAEYYFPQATMAWHRPKIWCAQKGSGARANRCFSHAAIFPTHCQGL